MPSSVSARTSRSSRVPASVEHALSVLRHAEQRALAFLGEVSGSTPLCGVDGRRAAVKEQEGAAVALSELRRAVGRLGRPDDVLVAAHEVRRRWERVRDRAPTGPGWTEYVAGGLAALRDVEGALAAVPQLERATDVSVTPVEPAPVASAPAEAVTRAAVAGRWPRRRRVVALLLTAAFAGVGLGGAPGLTAAPTSTLLGMLAAALAALALATYVPQPGTGRRLVVGCSPCAAVAGVAALASVGVLVSSPADGGAAALAVALAGVAAAHRLTAPDACEMSG